MKENSALRKWLKDVMAFCALLALGTGTSLANGNIVTGKVSGEAYSVDAGVKVDIGGLLGGVLNLVNLGGLLNLTGNIATIQLGPFPHVTLPPFGGFESETVATVNLLDIVNSGTLSNITSGGVGPTKAGAVSISEVENLNVLGLIKADLIASICSSHSDGTVAGSEATSSLLGLKILGKSISVSTPPNTKIDLLVKSGGLLGSLLNVGSVIINEQIETGDGVNTSSITNNALHISITSPKILSLLLGKLVSGNIIVSSAHCDVDVNRQAPPPEPDVFITGAGRLHSPIGFFATFGFNAREGQGQLVYNDRELEIAVVGQSVTDFEILDENCATFSGSASINGQQGHTYTVEACDFSDPGAGADTFTIDLSNGYHNSGTLVDGNIQLHP